MARPGAPLLPAVENLRAASATVAVAVRAAIGEAWPKRARPVQAVQDAMWQPGYDDLETLCDDAAPATTHEDPRRSDRAGRNREAASRPTPWARSRYPPSSTGALRRSVSLIHFSIGDDRMPKASTTPTAT